MISIRHHRPHHPRGLFEAVAQNCRICSLICVWLKAARALSDWVVNHPASASCNLEIGVANEEPRLSSPLSHTKERLLQPAGFMCDGHAICTLLQALTPPKIELAGQNAKFLALLVKASSLLLVLCGLKSVIRPWSRR